MLGLTVKDIVIGGIATTSLGLGAFNTISICKTKKRVKSCESYQNDIKSFQEKVNTFMDKSKSNGKLNTPSNSKNSSESNDNNKEVINEIENYIDDKFSKHVKEINSKLDSMITNNHVFMKDGVLYSERIEKLSDLVEKLENEFGIDNELKAAVLDMKTKLDVVVLSMNEFMKNPDKTVLVDSTVVSEIDELISEVNDTKKKNKSNK